MTRPPFITEFLAAVETHKRASVHDMLVAQADVIAAYIRSLEQQARKVPSESKDW